ncbi:hypothetical protein ACFL6I_16275 [candidate division KSB1 bacterium]
MRIIRFLQKYIKKMKWYDISLIKLSTFFATLFLITVWPGFRDLVMSIDWYWYLVLLIVAAIIPLKRMFAD